MLRIEPAFPSKRFVCEWKRNTRLSTITANCPQSLSLAEIHHWRTYAAVPRVILYATKYMRPSIKGPQGRLMIMAARPYGDVLLMFGGTNKEFFGRFFPRGNQLGKSI